MTSPRIDFSIPGYHILDVRRADGSGGWLVDARDTERDRPVLLKVIERRAATDADAIRIEERLRREARAAARVHHPSVVRMFDLGETDTLLYLVMERIDAPDADTVVRRDGPMVVAAACRVARDVARGLEELHRCGVVHRDITPGNVLIPPPDRAADGEGDAVIVDLGLARLRDLPHGLTAEDVLLGTPGFMAPEQAENPREADARADLYGLGALLYFMLTGRAPFEGEGLEPLRLALRGGAPDVRTLRPGTPPALARLIARMLSRSPDDRPAGAAEIAGALDAFMDEMAETQAVTTGDFPTPVIVESVRGPAAAAQRPWLMATAAAGFVALGAVGVALLTGGESPPDSGVPAVGATATTTAAASVPSTAVTAPAPAPAPSTPAPPRSIPKSRDLVANEMFQRAEGLMVVPPLGERDWLRFVIAQQLMRGVRRRWGGTWAAEQRVPARLKQLADAADGRRREALATLDADVRHLLQFAQYAGAAEVVADASRVLIDADVLRDRGAEVLEAARENIEVEFRRARRRAEGGQPLDAARRLEQLRDTAHPAHHQAIDQFVATLRNPDARRQLAGRVDQRPAEPLEALADRALAARKVDDAITLISAALANPAYAESRDVLQGRLTEAQAIRAFYDRLVGALHTRIGTRLPMPGGAHGELLEARASDGRVVWRRAGGQSGARLRELPAEFLAELTTVTLRPTRESDELALGLLFLYSDEDTVALEHLARGGPAAVRTRSIAQSRIAASRDERARTLLDRARAAWIRGAPATAFDRLTRLRRGSLLRDAGPVREAFDDLFDAVSRRLSGLDGLVAADIVAGATPEQLRLTWSTPEARAADGERGAGELVTLSPRWRAPLRAVWSRAPLDRAGAAQPVTEVDRIYRLALRTAAGSEALAVLHPNGTLSLHLDGREAGSAIGATLPLVLTLARRDGRGTLEVAAGDARIAGVDWASSHDLILAAGRTPGVLSISGPVDSVWLRAARAEADRPGMPASVRILGPPRTAVARWEAPIQGHATRYRVWVASTDGASPLAPLGVFTVLGETKALEAKLGGAAKGAVLGVFIEPIGRDGRSGPASAVRFITDLRGAGAVAVGNDGERYVTLPGATPLIRLRADGRPEAVRGAPDPARVNAEAARGLAIGSGRNGWRIALSDAVLGHGWAWQPGEPAAPLGAGTIHGAGGIAVDTIGRWWIAAPKQGRLFSFYGRDRGLIAPVDGPEGAQAFSARAPSHVAVLHDGRLAASDPVNARVVIYEPRLGWFKVHSVIDDLPGAGALAAGSRGTLWVATRTGVASVSPPAGGNAAMAPPIHTREVAGVVLKRVTGLATDPDGSLWVLDGGAGRLMHLRR